MLKILQLFIFISLVYFTSTDTPLYNDTTIIPCPFKSLSVESDHNYSEVDFGHDELDPSSNCSLFIKDSLNKSFNITHNDTTTVCKTELYFGIPCIIYIGNLITLISLLIQMLAFWLDVSPDIGRLCALFYTALIPSSWTFFTHIVYAVKHKSVSYYTLNAFIHFFLMTSISWLSMISTEAFANIQEHMRKLFSTIDDSKHLKAILRNLMALSMMAALLTTFKIFSRIAVTVFGALNDVLNSNIAGFEDIFYFYKYVKSPCLPCFFDQVVALAVMNFISHYVSNWIYKPSGYFHEMVEKRGKRPEILKHKYVFLLSVINYVIFMIGALASIPAVSWMGYIFTILPGIEIICIFFYSYKRFPFPGRYVIDLTLTNELPGDKNLNETI